MAVSILSAVAGSTGTHTRDDLLAHAADPESPLVLALAGVVGESLKTGARPLIAGLDEDAFARLMARFFPGVVLENGVANVPARGPDEFDDVLALLMEYRAEPSEVSQWLCHAVATASMCNNHLWQDMGLPSRKLLSRLMSENFPALAARNVGDMKWKKFFYRQLCERAGVPVCKSPNCADCTDYAICFGPEDD